MDALDSPLKSFSNSNRLITLFLGYDSPFVVDEGEYDQSTVGTNNPEDQVNCIKKLGINSIVNDTLQCDQ